METEAKQLPILYLAYAQKDKALKQEFEDYLIVLQQIQLIAGWREREVRRGIDWSQEIDPRSADADISILLLSPRLLASGYCLGAEFQQLTRKRYFIPVMLYAVNLTGYSPLESHIYLPRGGKPVSSWAHRYEIWQEIDQDLRAIIHMYSSAR
jgi:hypothetical protein